MSTNVRQMVIVRRTFPGNMRVAQGFIPTSLPLICMAAGLQTLTRGQIKVAAHAVFVIEYS